MAADDQAMQGARTCYQFSELYSILSFKIWGTSVIGKTDLVFRWSNLSAKALCITTAVAYWASKATTTARVMSVRFIPGTWRQLCAVVCDINLSVRSVYHELFASSLLGSKSRSTLPSVGVVRSHNSIIYILCIYIFQPYYLSGN